MPQIVGSAARVVEHDGLSIDELVGNVSTGNDQVSAAKVVIATPTMEPWLTLHYDEWICVTKGRCDMRYMKGNDELVLTVMAGQTCFIGKGERFRPEFPLGDTEYFPVCVPAFRPDRCIREEGATDSDVTKELKRLHSQGSAKSENNVVRDEAKDDDESKKYDSVEKLYHMCPKETWDAATGKGEAYFPPTFELDGNFIHATAVPSKLMEVGNHFYKSDKSQWICLEISRSALHKKCGIITKFEEAIPVGSTDTNENWEALLFPHIYGGIPTCVDNVVTNVFEVQRNKENGTFDDIIGMKAATN